jgi:DNA-binding NtrC family response regulator
MTDDSLLVGNSQAMRRVREQCARYGPRRHTVALIGETGTGKFVAAEEIHRHSAAADRPLVRISAAALRPEFVESTLAGHIKGSFTTAVASRVGLLLAAAGGCIFGDDFQDLHEEVQPYLLDVMESRPVHILGTERTITPAVRWILGLQPTPEELVTDGCLRADLAARWGLLRITIPPLRERPEDIGPLAEHLLVRIGAEESLPVPRVSSEALTALLRFPWPLNVRQLESVLIAAVLDAHEDGAGIIRLRHLDPSLLCLDECGKLRRRPSRAEIETALAESGDVVASAARRLGVASRTLWRYMKEFGIPRHGAVQQAQMTRPPVQLSRDNSRLSRCAPATPSGRSG